MKKKRLDRRLLWGGGTVLVLVLAACANYLAGAILFLTYKEHPAKAQFSTIQAAYASATDHAEMSRVKLSAGASILLCFVLPFAAVMQLRARPRGHDLYGNAEFADTADIKQEKLDAEVGLVLGRFKKKLLRLPGYEFVLLAAPTRTGKGVGFCIPNLLQFSGSAVVLDIKGENYNLTSEFRRRYMGNDIIYFNPYSENSTRWNPLSYVSKDPSYRANDLMGIAAIIYPVNEKEPFWANGAKNLFLGLALLVLETPELPTTMGEILRQGSGKGMLIEDYLGHVIAVSGASSRPLSYTCIDCLNRFLSSGEDSLKGVLATFSAALTPFANDVIDKATSGDDFDLRDVRKRKVTIYLTIPAAEMAQAAFIVNLFFSQLIRENVKELPEHNPALKHQCLLLLDEFTAMGKVEIIAKGVGFMAGYNMRLAIIIQDKSQLDSVYGKEDAHNIISNMGAVVYFTPSQVDEAEQYSKMIGNKTVLTDSRQRSKGQLFGLKSSGSDSTTESYQSRAVMLPQELMSMSKDEELIVRPGIPVIKANKIRYFSDPYFKERFNAVPMQDVLIGEEKRRVPVPTHLPKGEWQSYRATLASSAYYAKQVAPAEPAADGGAAPAAGVAPPPPSLAKQDVAGPAQAEFTLPPLPSAPVPYCALHALLSTPLPPPQPSGQAALAYADSILRYWQLHDAQDGLEYDAWLPIIDLSPGSGQFAWQLMRALDERLGSAQMSLPPFRYIACSDDEQQRYAMNYHPYFGQACDEERFVVSTTDALLSGDTTQYSANPFVVIGHGSLHALAQELVGWRDGKLFGIESRPAGMPGPRQRQLTLDHQWQLLDEATMPPDSAAVASHYRDQLGSGTVLLPHGALQLVGALGRVADGRLLMLSVDHAILDEREIHVGAYALAPEVTVPLEPLPTNYHAMAHHLRAGGASVWAQSIPESKLCVMMAVLADATDDSIADAMGASMQPLVQAHNGVDLRAAALARQQLLTLPDCLSLLQRSHHDPRIFEELFPFLRAANWKQPRTALEQWHRALSRCWAEYLPFPKTVDFYVMIFTVARSAGHMGLAREALNTGIAYFGETVDDLCAMADCELMTGNTNAARSSLERALRIDPRHPAATAMLREAERRLGREQSLTWFKDVGPIEDELRLEPLAPHHAEQLHFQYRDPRISAATMLPALDSKAATRTWIEGELAKPDTISCAVMHESWGLIGYASARCSGNAAQLLFWIGLDYQLQGYAGRAISAFIDILGQQGVHDLFAAHFHDNDAARQSLRRLGFAPMDLMAMSPHEALRFAHLGPSTTPADARGQLEHLCTALSVPIKLAASGSVPVSDEHRRSR